MIGQIIGRYGTEILMFSGSVKGVKLLMNLKKANAALGLESVSQKIGSVERLRETSQVATQASSIKG